MLAKSKTVLDVDIYAQEEAKTEFRVVYLFLKSVFVNKSDSNLNSCLGPAVVVETLRSTLFLI